jgi:DNA-directed RNA polymerase subunit RPC12/RpoP
VPTQTTDDPVRLICPRCRSRLEVLETASGGRTVYVMGLGESVSSDAKALELFLAPDAGPDIKCPACGERFDPSSPYRRFPKIQR